MKNKKLRLGLIVLAAVTVFTATAFAAQPEYQGYAALKQIMLESRNNTEYLSETCNGKFQLTDNGTTIAELSGSFKSEGEAKEGSGDIILKLHGKQQELAFYKSDDSMYLTDKNNSKYYKLINAEGDSNRFSEHDRAGKDGEHQFGAAEEGILDYLVGDLKSQVQMSEGSDGSKTFIIDLNKDEIPMPLNLLTALAIEKRGNGPDRNINQEMPQLKKQLMLEKLPFLKELICEEGEHMPQLTENVKLAALKLKFSADAENQFTSLDAELTITGNDSAGVFHEITLSVSTYVSDINSTEVDKFISGGKNIETVDVDELRCSN